jgi:hypothetical protein
VIEWWSGGIMGNYFFKNISIIPSLYTNTPSLPAL